MKGVKVKENSERFSNSQAEVKNQDQVSSNITRRQFMEKSLIGSAGLVTGSIGLMAQSSQARKVAPNEKIVLGFMGLGGRNCALMKECINQGAEIAYVCDVDTRRHVNGLKVCSEQSKPPKAVQDFRRMLDDKDVTALFIAPGSHWGPLGTIMSCQAGKDVYVEKPLSHDVYEGRKTVEAARKYKRIVQGGCQNWSGAYHEKAIEFLKSGYSVRLILIFSGTFIIYGVHHVTSKESVISP
jgi:predicted dehydrogenase